MNPSVPAARTARIAQAANLVALAALLGWIGYEALGPNVFGYRPWPEGVVDFHILYHASQEVAAESGYPRSYLFPYPPSAVVFFLAAAAFPFSVAAALWLTITVLATFGTLWLGMALVGLDRQPWRWLAALAAFAATYSFVQWDLRSQNCNMVYCLLLTAALALIHRGRPGLGGALLAGSVALKLYPVLVLPYLWWIGQRRAVAGALAGLVGLFGVLPWSVFGGGVVQVYVSWLEQIQTAASMAHHADHPILVSLPYTLTRIMGYGPWLARLAALVWLIGAACCMLAERRRGEARTTGWNLAVDGSLLALTPVVISPYLEPYHPVPALLLALALAQRAFDAAQGRSRQYVAGGGLLLGLLVLKSFALMGFHYRGLGILTQMLVLAGSLTLLRRQSAAAAADSASLPRRLAA